MTKNPVLVVGASGLVGAGIVRSLAARGLPVIAVSRRLEAMAPLSSLPGVLVLAGDVSSAASSAALVEAVRRISPRLSAAVVSVNPPRRTLRLTEAPVEEFADYLTGSLFTHLHAARALLPLVEEQGEYVAIGGASSDFVWPEHGHISVNQAAQRMLFKVLAHERKGSAVRLREYVIAAMVHDGTAPSNTVKGAVSADEVGEDFAARLFAADAPAVDRFPRKAPGR